MSRRPYEFDNFVIADGSAAVLDLAVNRRSFPAAEKTSSAETAEVLENVRARLDLLIKQLAEKEGINEQLKAENQMESVVKMNNIRVCAEEIVLIELSYN